MRNFLGCILAICFFASPVVAADMATTLSPTVVDRTSVQKPIAPKVAAPQETKIGRDEPGTLKPSLLPTTLSPPKLGRDATQSRPAMKGMKTTLPARKTPGALLPGMKTTLPARKTPRALLPGGKPLTPGAGLNTTIKPMTVTLATEPPETPILETITFHGQDPSGNLIWKVWVNNNHPTEYSELLKVNAMQERDGPGGLNSSSAGGSMVSPQTLAAGQRTQVGGSFTRNALATRLKLRLKNYIGPGVIYHEIQTPLPPDLTYQARIVSVNVTAATSNPLQVRVQNYGTNAIPQLSVQKMCANSSAPSNFTACGGHALSNIMPGQTVDSNHPLPLGWPTDPNIMKIIVRRGLTEYDEELHYP